MDFERNRIRGRPFWSRFVIVRMITYEWLYDLLKPHVTEVLVCNPRNIPLLKQGNKSDKIDARKLAERLRLHDLKPVYHGENGIRMLRELARSYLTVVKDLSRVMNRLKALYRSWAIPCAGRDVYYRRHRNQWLEKRPEAGTRRRAEQLYHDLKGLFKGAATRDEVHDAVVFNGWPGAQLHSFGGKRPAARNDRSCAKARNSRLQADCCPRMDR